jgi:hypothetical protein
MEVLTSAAVSAALTGFLVWLTKTWIGERLKNAIKAEYDQQLETHKAQLKTASDVEVERLKAQLSLDASERIVLFTRLQERRFEVIAETYALLRALHEAIRTYKPFTEPEKDERVTNAFNALRMYYPKKDIFLPASTAEKITAIHDELVKIFEEYRGEKKETPAGIMAASFVRRVFSARAQLNRQMAVALAELANELRTLLGDTNTSASDTAEQRGRASE